MTLTNSKTAEFARLFELFDRIATRRTRALAGDSSEVISADDISNVPADFAPILKSLSTVLSMRAALRDEKSVPRPQTMPTTNVHSSHLFIADGHSTAIAAKDQIPLADTVASLKEVEEDPEGLIFPLGERYPFTFKLMLHELYDLDEWAEKVKDAVEMSRSQFKPLAERFQGPVDLDVSADIKESASTSSIRPVLGASAKFKPPNTAHSNLTTMPFKPETSRALKKRCIGRRKSVNGPISSGAWVYNAAISATEVTGARPAVEISLPTPRGARGGVNNRARHYSLTAWEEKQARVTGKHKVRIVVPLLPGDSVSQGSSSFPPLRPAQKVIETGRVVTKRGSFAALTSEPCKAVKRPLGT